VAMTRLAIAGEAGFEISLADAPNASGEPNYSLETLERVQIELGASSRLYFLMGADSFLTLKNWHRASEIPFAAPLIVASRPGQALESLMEMLPEGLTIEAKPGRDRTVGDQQVRGFEIGNRAGERAEFHLLPGLKWDISATEVRARMRTQERAAVGDAGGGRLVPEAVAEFVKRHGLYR